MTEKRAAAWYRRYEKHFASLALVGGFIFDIFTIQRVDAVWENSWIIIHLLMVASVIILLSRRESRVDSMDSRLNFWLLAMMQFSFGGLLSAFLILYFRSASLGTSWPFLLILFLAFWVNERFKNYHQRLIFQISFFYLSLLSFLIFSVPIILGTIGPVIFIVSGVLSIFIFRIFFFILRRVSRDGLSDKREVLGAVFGIFAVMNILYFLNVIPPIPLSLKDAGIFHSISSDGLGNYSITTEPREWKDYLLVYEKVNITSGTPLFAYTAIFSPSRFNTRVVHEWQVYDENLETWRTMSRVSLPTSGGREQGFRTYSVSNVYGGKWRVNVLSEKGLVLGRVKFEVSVVSSPPVLVSESR